MCVKASHVQMLTTFLSLSCLYLYFIYSSFIIFFPKETKLACCSSRFSSARWERKVECCHCGERRGEGGPRGKYRYVHTNCMVHAKGLGLQGQRKINGYASSTRKKLWKIDYDQAKKEFVRVCKGNGNSLACLVDYKTQTRSTCIAMNSITEVEGSNVIIQFEGSFLHVCI